MSFFSNHRHPRPGPIKCNPIQGLCHRVAISARRILDSGLVKETLENTPIVVNERDQLPPPARFISAVSVRSDAIVSNLNISRIQERPSFARISCDVTTPLRVTFECVQGTRYEGTSQIMCSHDVVLFVPGEAMFPCEIISQTSANTPNARIDAQGNISGTVCLTTIIKVMTDADILIPSYGFAPPPPAVSFDDDACRGFFDLPLFPRGK